MEFAIIMIVLGFVVMVVLSYLGLNNNDLKTIVKPKTRYQVKLQSEQWKQKRMEIIKRDKFRCCFCGNVIDLCVHHKFYLKYPDGEYVEPWEYDNSALMTLCKKCHMRVHKSRKIKTYYKSRYPKITF